MSGWVGGVTGKGASIPRKWVALGCVGKARAERLACPIPGLPPLSHSPALPMLSFRAHARRGRRERVGRVDVCLELLLVGKEWGGKAMHGEKRWMSMWVAGRLSPGGPGFCPALGTATHLTHPPWARAVSKRPRQRGGGGKGRQASLFLLVFSAHFTPRVAPQKISWGREDILRLA